MALKGVKVLEFAGLAPAPFCGMILQDFGASVLRIDRIGVNTDLDCLANGKQSISLDIKASNAVNIIERLVKRSDVLIEPYRPGVMEKANLGPDRLMQVNPRLIYARLTGFGQNNKNNVCNTKAGHDINYVGLSGLLSMFGREDCKPVFPANFIADFGGGGLMCAFGILLALLERNSSNNGQVIDCSMVEGCSYLGSWLYRSQALGIWGNARGANILDSGAHFYEVYETKDHKYMAVGALEPQFYAQLLVGLGIEPQDAPQFGDFRALKLLFTQKFQQKTQKEWCDTFDTLDACVTPVLNWDEAHKYSHNMERSSFTTHDDTIIPNPAPRLSRTGGHSHAHLEAPKRGQHTRKVLLDLGFSPNEIKALQKARVIECYDYSKL